MRIFFITMVLILFAGCVSKDVLVIKENETDDAFEILSLNGNPISNNELNALIKEADYGDVDLIIYECDGDRHEFDLRTFSDSVEVLGKILNPETRNE